MAILLNAMQLTGQLSIVGADTPAFGPEELIEEVCLGEGIQVLDIQFSGVPWAVGRFSGGTGAVGLEEGFIMTTGNAATASGGPGADLPGFWDANIPNGSLSYSQELANLTNTDETYDVAIYTIRFIPTEDSIMFRYVFASEEYPFFVCSDYNDVFGFFLTGPGDNGDITTTNIARVPGTGLPVSINSVNGGAPGGHFSVNLANCQGDNGSLDFAALFNENYFDAPVYNGYTDVFVAKAAVMPCQEYTMSLVLADIGDALWDSGLFFEAKSFCSFAGGGHDSREEVTVVESCSPGLLEVALDNFPDADFPLTYTITGTAEAGIDYTLAGLSDSGQVDGPAEAWLLELETMDDGVAEGVETIEILLQGGTCAEKTFVIRLVDPLWIEGPPSALCSSGPVALNVVGDSTALASYPLVWDTGQEGASIQVLPEETTTYTLDYGGYLYSCRVSFTVEVNNPETELNLELCANDEGVFVNGTLYDFYNPTGTEVLPGESASGCDSTVHIHITPKVSFNLEEALCSGQSVTVNGALYDGSNLAGMEVIAAGAQDGCDSVIYVNLSAFPQQSSNLEATINEGETFYLGGQSFMANGNYELVFQDQNGCDSLVYLQLNVKTQTTVLTDSISAGQMESLCLDTSFFQSAANFTNVCPDPDAGTEWGLSESGACLEYLGLSPGIDTACLVICDDFGFCDTTILIVTVLDNVDAVWPGDVNNDGKVNQVDHWAIGLGYGLTGPVRPNASNAWEAQPMFDWNGSLFFIYSFNRKYADCNGDGEINSGDTYAIYNNWGLTHPLSPEILDYPDRAIPTALEAATSTPDYTELTLQLGAEALPDAYGLAFEAYFDPAAVADIQFSGADSWLGVEGEDMMVLMKVLPAIGKVQVSLVRTDHHPHAGSGRVGALRLHCPDNNCGTVTVRNVQYLQADGDAFDVGGEVSWQAEGLSKVASRLESQVQLFPNPARELLWVGLPAAGAARLFGANGQQVWADELQQGQNEISVNGFAPGVYFLKIQMPEGIVTKKVIFFD